MYVFCVYGPKDVIKVLMGLTSSMSFDGFYTRPICILCARPIKDLMQISMIEKQRIKPFFYTMHVRKWVDTRKVWGILMEQKHREVCKSLPECDSSRRSR